MSLEWPVALLVLLSAFLHASWNAITKSGRDPLLSLWMVTTTGSAVAGAATFFVDFPAREAWPWLGASVVLHLVYLVVLANAYRFGDLSQVYPIARGLSPLVVAGLAAVFAGEWLQTPQWAGLLLVSLGIGSLAFFARSGLPGTAGRAQRNALVLSLITGLLIASYTFVDGQGVRLSRSPLDFIAWMMFLDGLPLSIVVWIVRRGRFGGFWRRDAPRAAAGGVMGTLGYAIVMWAMAQGAMAQVSALRETSVIIAAIIGTRLLGEPFGPRRVLAAGVVALGVVLLQS